jgi:hypothetical protein
MSMTKIEFKATLQMLIPIIIKIIIERNKTTNISAVKSLYTSALYEKLEKESAKLWHLSPLALYELLEMELKTGKLIFPEEA